MARRRDAEEELRAEADRFLAFVGFDVDEALVVTRVQPDSEAERSGLTAGQRLLTLDGIRLDGRADLVPGDDGWQSRVTVRGTEGDELSLVWDRGAFRAADLDDLPRAFVWIGGALALLVASAGSRARGWAWVEARLGARKGEQRRGFLGVWGRLLATCHPGGVSRHLPAGLRLAPFVVFFLVFTLWSAIALGHPRVIGWLDFPALLLAALVSVLLAALVLGGQPAATRGRRRGFRLRQGLQEVLGALLAWSPIVLAAFGIVYEVGSLDLADLVAEQGVLPSRWRVFAAPWHLVSLALVVAACVPEGGPRRPPLGAAPQLGIPGGIGGAPGLVAERARGVRDRVRGGLPRSRGSRRRAGRAPLPLARLRRSLAPREPRVGRRRLRPRRGTAPSSAGRRPAARDPWGARSSPRVVRRHPRLRARRGALPRWLERPEPRRGAPRRGS